MYSHRILPSVACFLWLSCSFASAYTPDSPEVEELVTKAMVYLDRAPIPQRYGEKGLLGLAYFKVHGAQHPRVQALLKEFQSDNVALNDVMNYDLGIGIIFLAELSDKSTLSWVQKWVDELLARQKPHGGWGYDGHGHGSNSPLGDVSQTQYAVLAMWSARNAGAKVPPEPMEKVLDWLLRVQDPEGGWGYQGKDSEGKKRVSQNDANHPVTLSLTAAGLGATLVCADVFREGLGAAKSEKDKIIPESLKLVVADQTRTTAKLNLPKTWVQTGIVDGNKYMKTKFSIASPTWQYYYMYSLERYFSFRELYERKFEEEPEWYNLGVDFLRKNQAQSGIWPGEHSSMVSTCFAVLFLKRSAQKSIKRANRDLGEGVLSSGKGLPSNLSDAQVRQGKLVDSRMAAEVQGFMELLDDEENPELLRLAENGSALQLDADITKRQGQIAKLKSLVSAKNWESRLVAVRTLGAERNMDHVPVLLYALTDPDYQVVKAADEALRFLSRKFSGVGLEGEYTRKSVEEARRAWRQWYLSLRPNAELFD